MDDENEKLNELDEVTGNPDDVQPTDDGDTTMPAGPEVGTDGDDDGDDGGNTDGNNDGNDDGNDDGDTTLPAGPEVGTDGDGDDDNDGNDDDDTEETESGPQIRPTASDDGSGTLIKSFPLAEAVNDDDDLIIETSLPQTEHVHADTLRDYFRESILDSAYPVGSIYMTTESTSPARLFGGTWERITGMFLVGASNDFTANSTGGAQTVTLSTNNLPAHTHSLPAHTHSLPSHTHSLPSHTHSLPSHTHSIPSLSGTAASAGSHSHSIYYRQNCALTSSGDGGQRIGTSSSNVGSISSPVLSAGAHTHSVTTNSSTTGSASGTSGSTSGTSGSTSGTSGSTSGTSGSTGNGSAFSIMPPYLAVYMWKRTA